MRKVVKAFAKVQRLLAYLFNQSCQANPTLASHYLFLHIPRKTEADLCFHHIVHKIMYLRQEMRYFSQRLYFSGIVYIGG